MIARIGPILWCALALMIALTIAVLAGAVHVSPRLVLAALTGRAPEPVDAIVWGLRLPRAALAALVGAALGMSGSTLQTTLRNPLAEPYLLGVSGGAAVGAVAATVAGLGAGAIPLAALTGAAGAIALAVLVARAGSPRPDAYTLLMAGVVVGALANAVIMIALANAPPDSVRGALWWMMGSVADASWSSVRWLALYAGIGAVVLGAIAPHADALSLGDDAAAALGVDVERTTRNAFLASALVAGASVAAAGLVGFVGLVVPHIARAASPGSPRMTLACSALAGAALTVSADVVARTVAAPAELPLGAVTAVLGVPFFLWQLARRR